MVADAEESFGQIGETIGAKADRFERAVAAIEAGPVTSVNGMSGAVEVQTSVVGDYLNTFADPGSKWLRRNGGRYRSTLYPALASVIRGRFLPLTVPTSVALSDAAYGATSIVIVGQSGTVLTGLVNTANENTSDGWTVRSSGASTTLLAVEFGASLFVAVGRGGTIITSPNGTAWTTRTSGTAEDIVDLTWTGSFFLAVTSGGKALRSTNGIDWTIANVSSIPFNSVVFANGTCVLFGNNSLIYTTTNGTSFTQRSSASGAGSVVSSAYGASLFVGVGFQGTIITSPNGATWTARESPFGGTALFSVVFDGANFLAFLPDGRFAISSDGLTWIAGSTLPAPSGPYVSLVNGKLLLMRGLSPHLSVAEPTGSAEFPVPNDNPATGWIRAFA